jgi:site-specific DNA-methyltransferase (adenine-specific)
LGKELLGSLELNRIYQFDCVDGMNLIPDKSVDLTVTSPPYDNLRTYNGYVFNFEQIAKQLYRITKEGGVVVWVVSDGTENGGETLTSFKQALFFKDIGFTVHDTMIYQKNSYPFPPSNRYYQQFEYMFIFSKGKPKTANLLRCEAQGRKRVSTTRNPDGTTSKTKYETGHKTRVRDNVWLFDTGYMRTTKDKEAYKHPAMFPEQLAEDHILSWSNEGDIVFDPMCGAGTTCKMSQINKRKYIGFEISPEYIQIANMRLESLTEDF